MWATGEWKRVLMPVALAAVVFALVVAVIVATRETGQFSVVWPVNALVLAIALGAPRSQRLMLLAAAFVGSYPTKPFRPDELLKRVKWLMDPPAVVPTPLEDGLVLDVRGLCRRLTNRPVTQPRIPVDA